MLVSVMIEVMVMVMVMWLTDGCFPGYQMV
jgi:hypothetical protein